MNIQAKLKELGYNCVPTAFYNKVDMWKSWYDGKVDDFHSYSVYNGIEYLDCQRYSLGMGKKASEDWANLLLNEKVSITLEGEKEQAFVQGVLEDNNFRVRGNEMQERKAALGTVAYVPRVENLIVREDTGEVVSAKSIKLDYCTAPSIYPLSWENGVVKECAFASSHSIDGEVFTYIQLHIVEDGKYTIKNKLFKGEDEVPLTAHNGFRHISPEVRTGSTEPQFVLDRLNIANPDPECPMGVSVFAGAIDQLKSVDIAYDGYVNEFVLGKKRIMVKPEVAQDINGRPFFDARETVYYVLPEDSANNGSLVEQVDMTLRAEEFNAGMQDMLNLLSSKCGFGENHYKFEHGNVATATQIVSENSTLFRTIKKHELILHDVLTRLCRTILRMGNQYMNAGLDEDVAISIDFDDSIIEDKETDFNRDCRLLQMGIMNDWEFRMKWMNEDEETAKKLLPRLADMSLDSQDDVE